MSRMQKRENFNLSLVKHLSCNSVIQRIIFFTDQSYREELFVVFVTCSKDQTIFFDFMSLLFT